MLRMRKLVPALIFAFGVFLLDFLLPVPAAVAVLYAVPLLLAFRHWNALEIKVLAYTGSGLALAACVLSLFFHPHFFAAKITNALLAVTVLWAASVFVRRLKERHAEIEQFASVAAHDLRAPLREIRMFIDLIRQSPLDPAQTDYFGAVQKAVYRMQRLIQDILTHARVSKEETVFEEVDLKNLVEQVLEDLQSQLKQKQAFVEIIGLPKIRASRPQMRQLFQNLIENALKYSRKEHAPRVRIDYQINGSLIEIRISDNGVGFDEVLVDKIFMPFQRFQKDEEGTGMGLAICSQIVQRHGGRITAHSKPNEGSTFLLNLPV